MWITIYGIKVKMQLLSCESLVINTEQYKFEIFSIIKIWTKVQCITVVSYCG